MARVPALDNFSVLPQGGSQQPVAAPAVRDFSSGQQRQLGQAIAGAGEMLNRVQIDRQQMANQIRVDDAVNKMKEEATRLTFDPKEGYQAQKGIAALERESGGTLTDDYDQQLAGRIGEIESSLGNDAQKLAFRQSAANLRTQFRGDIMKHEADEFQTYALSVSEGVIANRIDAVGRYWNDPARVDAEVLSIKAQVDQQRRLLGKSAEWGEARTRELVSNAHMGAIAAAIENDDVSYAEKYLDLYKDDMTAADITKVDGAITKQMDAQVAWSVADETFTGGQAVNPNPSKFTMPVRGQITSGFGMRTAPMSGASSDHNGVDIAVPKGTGVSAPSAGKVQKVWRDPKGGLSVIVDHGNGIVTGYAHLDSTDVQAGDSIAAGAVFAKSGNSGNSTGPHLHYTMKINGKPVDPTKPHATGSTGYSGKSLLSMIQGLSADPRLAGNPERLQLAEARIRSLYSAQEEGEREQKEQARDSAFQTLYATGGDMTKLSASQRIALGDDISSAVNFANGLQKAAGKVNPAEANAVWAAYRGNPDTLMTMTPSQLTELLPTIGRENYKDLVSLRDRLIKGEDKALNTEKVIEGALKTLDADLRAAGYDTASEPGSAQAKEYAAFRGAYMRALQAEESTTGKGVTPDRAREIGLGLTKQYVVDDGWLWDTKKKPYEVGGRVPYNSIPTVQRNAIIQMLRRASPPGTAITQGMVTEEYARYLNPENGKK